MARLPRKERSLPIERIRRRYKREWLLIVVDKMDEATTTPLEGRLLAHSPSRSVVHRASMRYPGFAMVVFSTDKFLPGQVAAFRLHA